MTRKKANLIVFLAHKVEAILWCQILIKWKIWIWNHNKFQHLERKLQKGKVKHLVVEETQVSKKKNKLDNWKRKLLALKRNLNQKISNRLNQGTLMNLIKALSPSWKIKIKFKSSSLTLTRILKLVQEKQVIRNSLWSLRIISQMYNSSHSNVRKLIAI